MVTTAETTTGTESPTIIPSRSGTSQIGTSSPNSSAAGNTNSSYGGGAFTSGIGFQAATTYQLNNTDYGGVVLFNTSSAVTVTLNSAVADNFTCNVTNIGTGGITLVPTGGYTVNGAASLSLGSGQGATVFFANRQWIAYVGTQVIQVVPITFGAVANEWLTSYSAVTGLFTAAQPAFTNISGNLAATQLPADVPVVSFGSGAPSGSSTEGYVYFDTSASPYQGYVFHTGSWQKFS